MEPRVLIAILVVLILVVGGYFYMRKPTALTLPPPSSSAAAAAAAAAAASSSAATAEVAAQMPPQDMRGGARGHITLWDRLVDVSSKLHNDLEISTIHGLGTHLETGTTTGASEETTAIMALIEEATPLETAARALLQATAENAPLANLAAAKSAAAAYIGELRTILRILAPAISRGDLAKGKSGYHATGHFSPLVSHLAFLYASYVAIAATLGVAGPDYPVYFLRVKDVAYATFLVHEMVVEIRYDLRMAQPDGSTDLDPVVEVPSGGDALKPASWDLLLTGPVAHVRSILSGMFDSYTGKTAQLGVLNTAAQALRNQAMGLKLGLANTIAIVKASNKDLGSKQVYVDHAAEHLARLKDAVLLL